MNTGSMPKLRLIGYWRSDLEPWWPDVHEFVDTGWDARERSMVAAYLQSAVPTPLEYLGYSDCRFCGDENGNCEQTDGTYLWPEGLAHYVTEHNVRLPDEFVAHARSSFGHWPKEIIDDTWWRSQQSL